MFNHSVKETMSNSNRSEMGSISSQTAREGRIIYCPSEEGDRAAGLGLFRRSPERLEPGQHIVGVKESLKDGQHIVGVKRTVGEFKDGEKQFVNSKNNVNIRDKETFLK